MIKNELNKLERTYSLKRHQRPGRSTKNIAAVRASEHVTTSIRHHGQVLNIPCSTLQQIFDIRILRLTDYS